MLITHFYINKFFLQLDGQWNESDIFCPCTWKLIMISTFTATCIYIIADTPAK